MSDRDKPAQEIVIIRRRGGHDDDHHHGGVWKIAYADFMTAMMAFFLVMWLVNATSKETKVSIASYFNPIKLTDQTPRSKGLQPIEDSAAAADKHAADKAAGKEQQADKAKKAGKEANQGSKDKKRPTEANDGKVGPSNGGAAIDQSKESASKAGEAFRDPFSPLLNAESLDQQKENSQASAVATPPPFAAAAETTDQGKQLKDKTVTATTASDTDVSGAEVSPAATGRPDQNLMKATAEKVRRQAEAAVKQFGMTGGPGVEVAIENDSVVVSLTDTSTFGMFAVGSAEPNAETIKLVRAITPVVASHGTKIIVRGHTDSRPFRGDSGNNNWRLSMQRAEAVHMMLVRTNIDEARFERIEAYADRKLKTESDPSAAANRRIEIVLRMDGK